MVLQKLQEDIEKNRKKNRYSEDQEKEIKSFKQEMKDLLKELEEEE